MKAVKVYNIQWMDSEKDLPKVIGFKTKNDFNVAEQIPQMLYKKYGVNINTFSFAESPIAETVTELLLLCKPAGSENPKEIFTPTGKLSGYGKICKQNMLRWIKERMALEEKGVSETEMLPIYDTIMLGMEKISGFDWDDTDHNIIIGAILDKISNRLNSADDIDDEF